MGSDYNSELISRLYTSTKFEDINFVLDQMEDIKDPVFIKPIVDGYYRFYKSYFGHYFLSALNVFKSNKLSSYLEEILKFTFKNKLYGHIAWVLHALDTSRYYPEIASIAAGFILKNFFTIETFNDTDLNYSLEYLKNSGLIDKFSNEIRTIFLGDSTLLEKKTALEHLLRVKENTKEFVFLIDNYKMISDKEAEIIVAKELLNWNGRLSSELKKKIIESGHERAREILELDKKNREEKQKLEKKENVENENNKFANVQIITDTYGLRERINAAFIAKLGIDIFPENTLLFKQQKTVTSDSDLYKYCGDLRAFIWSLNTEQLEKHNLSEDQIKKILPTTDPSHYNKPLHLLRLYLVSNNIEVDKHFYNFGKFNYLITMLSSHREVKDDITELLKEHKINDLFVQEKWKEIHEYLLLYFKKCLDSFWESINKWNDKK